MGSRGWPWTGNHTVESHSATGTPVWLIGFREGRGVKNSISMSGARNLCYQIKARGHRCPRWARRSQFLPVILGSRGVATGPRKSKTNGTQGLGFPASPCFRQSFVGGAFSVCTSLQMSRWANQLARLLLHDESSPAWNPKTCSASCRAIDPPLPSFCTREVGSPHERPAALGYQPRGCDWTPAVLIPPCCRTERLKT